MKKKLFQLLMFPIKLIITIWDKIAEWITTKIGEN